MNSPTRTQPKIATHTPTPWAIGRLERQIVREVPDLCDSADCYILAEARFHGLLPLEEARANAAFIVEAVNNHEALKARIQELEEALRHLDSLLDFSDEDVDPVWTFEDTTSIQAAFARAHAALQPKEPK